MRFFESFFEEVKKVCEYCDGSKHRWFLDLNQHSQENVEVPTEEAPKPDIDPYHERDPDLIQSIFDSQRLEEISLKKNEIRRVLKDVIQKKNP